MRFFTVLVSVFMASFVYSSNTYAELDNDILEFSDAAKFSKGNVFDPSLRGSKRLALTFDDGPSATTPLVLSVLRKHGIKAVFLLTE